MLELEVRAAGSRKRRKTLFIIIFVMLTLFAGAFIAFFLEPVSLSPGTLAGASDKKVSEHENLDKKLKSDTTMLRTAKGSSQASPVRSKALDQQPRP